MVCLKAPELRMLKEDYGESYRDDFMASAQQLHSGSLTDDPEAQIAVANLGTLPDQEEEDGATLRAANTSMVMSMSSQEDSTIDEARSGPTDGFLCDKSWKRIISSTVRRRVFDVPAEKNGQQ